jgi:hypothetical protein
MASMNLVGRCGIYCGACPVYLGARGNDEAAKYALEQWKVGEDQLRCEGCQGLTPDCFGNGCGYRECMMGTSTAAGAQSTHAKSSASSRSGSKGWGRA